MVLRREDVQAFRERDWEGLRRYKERSLLRWVEANGTTAALRLGDQLRAQVWPRARELKAREGFAGLMELRRKLTRAAAPRR